MKKINVREAEGYELCHDITQILPGQFKGAKFLRGHIIKKERFVIYYVPTAL